MHRILKTHLFILLTLILFFIHPLKADIPKIDSKGVINLYNEVLSAHVTFNQVDETLAARILDSFIRHLDPSKNYFIESEIYNYLNPNKEILAEVIKSFQDGDFQLFEKIFNLMQLAIQRHDKLEKQIQKNDLIEDPDSYDIQKSSWCKNIEELQQRIILIQSLVVQSLEKIETIDRDHIQKILDKRQRLHNENFNLPDKLEEKRFFYSVLLKAATTALDPQTQYFSPSEAKQFFSNIQKRLFGIGVQLTDNFNGFLVTDIIKGGPADKHGVLKKDDLVIAVDQTPVIGMDIIDFVSLVRGLDGVPVNLRVIRNNQDKKNKLTLDINIVRGEVILEESRFEQMLIPYGKGHILYFRLHSFYIDPKNSSAKDLSKAIQKAQEKTNLYGVLLDLRNNLGGPIDQAVETAGLFISQGVVVSTKDSTQQIKHFRNWNKNPLWGGPLVILVNRLSASASEIVAGSLQDYQRAILVGDNKTFGKGSFQYVPFASSPTGEVNPRGEYRVTNGRYYTVSGKSPQLIGLNPHIVIPGPLSESDYGEEFSIYPLSEDSILPHFKDDLSDIPILYRAKMYYFYGKKPHKINNQFFQFLSQLKKNSLDRILQDVDYQELLNFIQISQDNFLAKKSSQEENRAQDISYKGFTDLQSSLPLNILDSSD